MLSSGLVIPSIPPLPKSKWIDDSTTNECHECNNTIESATFSSNKHHCRFCGNIVCSDCSTHRLSKQRVCTTCFDYFNDGNGHCTDATSATEGEDDEINDNEDTPFGNTNNNNNNNPITLLWNKLFQENDGNDHKQPIHRILFILANYHSWLQKSKSKHQKQNQRMNCNDFIQIAGDGDGYDGPIAIYNNENCQNTPHKNDELICEYIWQSMSQFMSLLPNYSKIDLFNDFQLILYRHFEDSENGNKIRIYCMNLMKTEYQIDIEDECNTSSNDNDDDLQNNVYECLCLQRRNESNFRICKSAQDYQNRKKRYFLPTINANDNSDINNESLSSNHEHNSKDNLPPKKELSLNEMREILLQSKLDVIHIALLHDISDNYSHCNSDKFCTVFPLKNASINEGSNDEEEKECAVLNMNGNNDNDIERDLFLENDDSDTHLFGEFLTYWNQMESHYVSAKYQDLRSELLNNNIFNICNETYTMIANEAQMILQSKKGSNMKCLREHNWMRGCYVIYNKNTISIGDSMTLEHIIALICYCNIKELRDSFKCNGFNMETNTEIWNWSKLIFESVHCFGDVIPNNIRFYHKISRKLLFSQFELQFESPTSSTMVHDALQLQLDVCNGGCMLVLGHITGPSCLYLSLSLISDYPLEKEELFHHSRCSVLDVMSGGVSYQKWIDVLKLYEQIRKGIHIHRHAHVCEWDKSEIETGLVDLIELFMDENGNGNDVSIPEYIVQCFRCLTVKKSKSIKNNNKAIWYLNASEIETKVESIKLQWLLKSDSMFINHLSDKYSMQFYKVCNYEWVICGDDYDNLFKFNDWVKSTQICTINMWNQEHYFKFHFEIRKNTFKNDGALCALVALDEMADDIQLIQFGFSAHIPLINQSIGPNSSELSSQKTYALTLGRICNSQLLKNRNKQFVICFTVQMQKVRNKAFRPVYIDHNQI